MPARRLKAVWDVNVPVIRELAGVHDYDGVVMDLSPSGRQAALERLGPSSPDERLADRHDENHLSAAERAAHVEAEAEILRWNPLPHIQNLDVSCYDREYAPEPQRRRAREAHLAQWPEAVDASLESLQAVPAPVAGALVQPVRGLAEGINGTTGAEVAALRAHSRLLGRIQMPPPRATRMLRSARRHSPACSGTRSRCRSISAAWRSEPTPSATGFAPDSMRRASNCRRG